MPRTLTQNTLTQFFLQESSDPFLLLITLSHPQFPTIRLVNNNEDVISRGNTFTALAMRITLQTNDGESIPQISIVLDNVPIELMDELRSTTTPANVLVEAILKSLPDVVEISIGDLLLSKINYSNRQITATLVLNDLFNQRIPGELYSPQFYPGMFT